MISKKHIDAITTWLKDHNRLAVTIDMPPYEPLAIELQDWSDVAGTPLVRLFVGYWRSQNGDVVPDPSVEITMGEDAESVSALVHTLFCRGLRDDAFANDFLEEVVSRLSLVTEDNIK